jgi:zinc transport system substrate-binding protein
MGPGFVAMVKTTILLLIVLIATAGGGCGGSGDAARSGKPSVFVSIEPLAYFAEQIGGSEFDIHVLVASAQSPATYEPTARQMAALAESKAFFTIGVPMEQTLVPRLRSSMPAVRIVDTREGIELIELESSGREHGHGATDPHIWLDPARARMMAHNIYRALADLEPDLEPVLAGNLRELNADLDLLAAELTGLLAPVRGRTIVVFHPAYGYFADAFELKQVAIEAGGVTPGSKHLAEVVDMARARGVNAIFVQPQFSSATANAVATSIGATVVNLDPMARDYPENMRKIAGRIRSALQAAPSGIHPPGGQ